MYILHWVQFVSRLIYLVNDVQDADEEVALEAAEFWLAYCESDMGMELLQPVLSRLIPVLMKNMVGAVGISSTACAGHC